jgi:hypothetical protein
MIALFALANMPPGSTFEGSATCAKYNFSKKIGFSGAAA